MNRFLLVSFLSLIVLTAACGGGKSASTAAGSTPSSAQAASGSPTPASTQTSVASSTPAATSASSTLINVLTDDFKDAVAGWLPNNTPPNQDVFTRAYESGEYVVRRRAAPVGESNAQMDGSFLDVVISVDARLVGDEDGRYISLKCRIETNGVSYYRMNIDVATRIVSLQKFDNRTTTNLGPTSRATVNNLKTGGQMNRFQLSCIGTAIAGSVNGTQVVSVQEDALKVGGLQIGLGTRNADLTAEARFDNLSVDSPVRRLDPPTGDRLRIQRIAVDAPVSVHVVGPNGQLATGPEVKPDEVLLEDFAQNWSTKYGGAPGSGNTVMDGKRDDGSNACLNGTVQPPCAAVFFNLGIVRDGDPIQLFWHGQTYTYTVVSRCIKAVKSENWDAVYAITKPEVLTITTATGQFDAATRSYSDTLIVTAERTKGSVAKECLAGGSPAH